MAEAQHVLFGEGTIELPRGGPLYLQLKRFIEDAVSGDQIKAGDALPSERDLAAKMDVSRVTVRKAVQHLVQEGVLVQRHGSGTYVAPHPGRVEQSLSQLTSFTEDMARRGMVVRSVWLDRGLYAPSPEETVTLGLSSGDNVARVARLRISGDTPLAIERAALSSRILPDPEFVGTSLYAHLDKTRQSPGARHPAHPRRQPWRGRRGAARGDARRRQPPPRTDVVSGVRPRGGIHTLDLSRRYL